MDVKLVDRSSSHYTRMARIIAHELNFESEFVPVTDLTSLSPDSYAGNPSLSIPILLLDGTPIFGTLNICRTISKMADNKQKIFWSEQQADNFILQNANELIMTAMSTQVTIVYSRYFANISLDNPLLRKLYQRLHGIMDWLEDHWTEVQSSIPTGKLSTMEVALFCLLAHLDFRKTEVINIGDRLAEFASMFGERKCALVTDYKMDVPD